MSGAVPSCAGSSCRSVVLGEAEVSLLDRYKSFMSCVPIIVADGGVLSVCDCMDLNACSIVMALYGVCGGSVFAASPVVCLGLRL